jgi:hypothetical protein
MDVGATVAHGRLDLRLLRRFLSFDTCLVELRAEIVRGRRPKRGRRATAKERAQPEPAEQ